MFLRKDRVALACAALLTCFATRPAVCQETKHILFVGDSFTHGRYLPVRTYNNSRAGSGSTEPSQYVVDENYGATGEREEDKPGADGRKPGEPGPWGGIPGIFAELAYEAKLPYDVHIEAISAATLWDNYNAAKDVIKRPSWNAVVLQDKSAEPIDHPHAFCETVKIIESAIHTAARNADVYLYSTWVPADDAYRETTDKGRQPFSADGYLQFLDRLTAAYHEGYISAAFHDGHIRDIAPVGDAWRRAWRRLPHTDQRVANNDPYDPYPLPCKKDPGVASPAVASGQTTDVPLTFGYQPGSHPSTECDATSAGFHHPSIYGAYLSGLVLFDTITEMDASKVASTLKGEEQAAKDLGISEQTAVQLQQVAWESVMERDDWRAKRNPGPCSSDN
jgi:hypothetical protein